MLMAIFRRRWDQRRQRFGPRHYIGHVVIVAGHSRMAGKASSEKTRAIEAGRRGWPIVIRSNDLILAEHDSGRRRYYGTGAPAPGGTGLL